MSIISQKAVVGLSQTGKSSLVNRFLTGTYSADNYVPTVGCLLDSIETKVDGQNTIKVVIMDTPGREDDIDHLPKWFNWADAIIVVYSIGLKHSFEVVKKYMQSLSTLSHDAHKRHVVPIALVGAKEDLDRQFKRLVPLESGQTLASASGAMFFETSSKTESGVKQLWNKLLMQTQSVHMQLDEIVKKMSTILTNFKQLSGMNLASPGRYLVKDGLVTRFLPFENRKKECYLALFNDYICICKGKYGGGGTVVVRNAITLGSAIIIEGPSIPKKGMFFFRIHHSLKAKSYDFFLPTQAEKLEWLDILEEHVNATKCNGQQIVAPAMIEEFQLKNMNRLWKRSERLFGVGLSDLVQKLSIKSLQELQLEPAFLARAFEYLRTEKALECRGIFQLPTIDSTATDKLRNMINLGNEVDFDGQPYAAVADLITMFFKQLPLSVVPKEFTEQLIKFYDMEDETKRLEGLCTLLSAIPASNFAVLVDVLVYLGCAVEQWQLNGLTHDRAGIVFSKLLMHFDSRHFSKCSGIISYMIDHVEELIETHNNSSDLATKKPSTATSQSSTNYLSTYNPVPSYLYRINRERQMTCLNKCKYKLLEIIKLISSRSSSRERDYETAFQSMLINLNTITNYEPIFVKHLIDVTQINSFYLRLLEFARLISPPSSSKSSKPGKSAKLFSSNNDALEAEKIKAALETTIDAIFAGFDSASNWSREVRTAYFKIKKELERAQQLKQALGIPRDTELETTMAALQPMYADSAVREFWDKNFGLEKFVVKVDLFIDSLLRLNGDASGSERTISDSERTLVRHILDHYQTGTVNIYRFAIFVSGFGPIEKCINNVIDMSSQKWFYGFVSYPESLRLLECCAPGTFLVRFSQSNPGNFSVDYLFQAPPTGPAVGSPARPDMQQVEVRTIKIHNSPGGFDVVTSDITGVPSNSGSDTSSAPASNPGSAPSSGKIPSTLPPTSVKLIAAQGSFRMRTMTLLQVPEKRKSLGLPTPIPAHVTAKPSGTSSAPSSSSGIQIAEQRSLHSSGGPPSVAPPAVPSSAPPTMSPPATPTPPPATSTPPPTSQPPQIPPPSAPISSIPRPLVNSKSSSSVDSVPEDSMLVSTSAPALQSTTIGPLARDISTPTVFPSIEAILNFLKEHLHTPLQPNYFLYPYFHGCIDEKEALKKLDKQPSGSFLARFGDSQDTIAVYYVVGSYSNSTSADGASNEVVGVMEMDESVSRTSLVQNRSTKIETAVLERVFGRKQLRHNGITYKSLKSFINKSKIPLNNPIVSVLLNTDEPEAVEDGTLEKIVEKLYDGSDLGAINIFLMTYRSFATPTAVIHILRERIQYHRDHGIDRGQRLRMGNFIKTWITEYSWDIINEPDFYKLCSKLINDLTSDPATAAIGNQLGALLQKHNEAATSATISLNLSLSDRPLRADRAFPKQDLTSSGISNGSTHDITLIADDERAYSEGLDEDDEFGMSSSPSSSVILEKSSDSPRRDTLNREARASMSMSKDSIANMSGSPASPHGTMSSLSLSGNLTSSGTWKTNIRDLGASTIRSVIEIPIQDLAEQLTLIESELFNKIALHEFLGQGWLKADKELRSPNVLKMVRLATRISRWVVSEILLDEKPPRRAKVIEYFLSVAQELQKIGNFSTIMAILAALSGSAVGRLKKTWDAFPKNKKKELDELQALMETDSNWMKYRAVLEKTPPPKIPYLGLVLTDLVFIEDGNVDRLPNGHINWVKCERVAACLHSVQLSQQTLFKFTPVDALIDPYIFEYAKILTENEAYQRSLLLEPRSAKKK